MTQVNVAYYYTPLSLGLGLTWYQSCRFRVGKTRALPWAQ